VIDPHLKLRAARPKPPYQAWGARVVELVIETQLGDHGIAVICNAANGCTRAALYPISALRPLDWRCQFHIAAQGVDLADTLVPSG
jgi:hypothetical protein